METPYRGRGLVNKRLMIALSIVFGVVGTTLLVITIFNLRVNLEYVTRPLGLPNYDQGLPVTASTELKIVKTMGEFDEGRGNVVRMEQYHTDERKSRRNQQVTGEMASTVTRKSGYFAIEADTDIAVNEVLMNRAVLHLQPKNFWHRLYFMYPGILNSFVASFCFWFLALFVSNIQEGGAFTKRNGLRLQRVGWAILGLQALYYIQRVTPTLIDDFYLEYPTMSRFSSSDFWFRASPESEFSVTWALIGALILVVASAFRDGEMLQEEKNLTI